VNAAVIGVEPVNVVEQLADRGPERFPAVAVAWSAGEVLVVDPDLIEMTLEAAGCPACRGRDGNRRV